MPRTNRRIAILFAVAGALLVLGAGLGVATATAPCGDLGECKALIEINAADGDIGFHFLADGDDLVSTQISGPTGAKVFENSAKGPLREQMQTETFGESAEPLCWADPDADPDDEIVTLEEFLARWPAGMYTFSGQEKNGPALTGQTMLSHALPAAPAGVSFDPATRVISWVAGGDLGNCASGERLSDLILAGVIPDPATVAVAAWEVVLEPDVEGLSQFKYTVRIPGDAVTAVTVPADYLAALPAATPLKLEVGAIGDDDNATFMEADGFCRDGDCPDEG